MIFNASIVNHSTPAISVQVADSSGVTYNQIKQSLGSQVYDVKGLYLYSENTSQLIGTIQYQRYDSSGNQNITYIPTLVNPYQNVGALLVDLTDKGNVPFILNGNSSLSTTIYPQTYIQVKLLSSRITNSFGNNLSNFMDMQKITNTKFFENYGNPIGDVQATKKIIAESIQKNFDGSTTFSTIIKSYNINDVVITVVSAVAFTAGVYIILNNTKILSNVIKGS